jgi:hypothetical protein
MLVQAFRSSVGILRDVLLISSNQDKDDSTIITKRNVSKLHKESSGTISSLKRELVEDEQKLYQSMLYELDALSTDLECYRYKID